MTTLTIQEALLKKFNGNPAAVKQAVRNQNRVGRWYRAEKIHHALYTLSGGPWDGHTLELSGPSTHPFQVGNWPLGYYTREQWLRNLRGTVTVLHWRTV